MNNSSMEAKYVDPDPTSALFLGSWFAIVGVLGIPLNLFIVVATVKIQEIRAVSSNMFIGSLALSDALFLLCLFLHLPYALSNNETLCKVVGVGISVFAVVGTCIPQFLALNRYAIVCRQQEKLARYMFKAFSRKGTYWMICLLWTFEIIYSLPFITFDTLGVNANGACTILKKSTNALFFRIYFYCGFLPVFALSYVSLFVFYRKVSSWVKSMSAQLSLSVERKETIRETENVLLLTKWVTLIPLLFSSPALLITILFEFDSEIVSVGVTRLITTSYPFIPLLNAVITLRFARPYRLSLKEVCDRTTLTSVLFSWIIEGRWRNEVESIDSHT